MIKNAEQFDIASVRRRGASKDIEAQLVARTMMSRRFLHLRSGYNRWTSSHARIQAEFDSAPSGSIILAGDSHASYTPSKPFSRPILNAGIAGATAESYARTLRKLRPPRPAILSIIILGTNDLTSQSALSKKYVNDFSKNIHSIVRHLQRWSQDVLVAALPPTPTSRIREREPISVEVYTEVIKAVSDHNGVKYFDPFASLRAERFGLSHDNHFIDGIHFHQYYNFAFELASYLRENFYSDQLISSTLPGFDEEYYVDWYPDTVRYPFGAARHYTDIGWLEGRDPSGSFSTDGYLLANSDVAAAGLNPLVHFLEIGLTQGRTGWQKSCTKPTHHGLTERDPDLVKNQKVLLDRILSIET